MEKMKQKKSYNEHGYSNLTVKDGGLVKQIKNLRESRVKAWAKKRKAEHKPTMLEITELLLRLGLKTLAETEQ